MPRDTIKGNDEIWPTPGVVVHVTIRVKKRALALAKRCLRKALRMCCEKARGVFVLEFRRIHTVEGVLNVNREPHQGLHEASGECVFRALAAAACR